ncbi:SDR family NAD(P)-dependent oxidoreductase [Pontibacter silvestris]|uniref:SDR family NAD(P)-dependent oxidoreductase n=1 Tax=Pontibacter silvestris TaxID=2305183 RepID=A0ABW4WU57_9BACT|nr:SDR family NAD(P)-dependent oxidoreductase [Pontibacter silvestris]
MTPLKQLKAALRIRNRNNEAGIGYNLNTSQRLVMPCGGNSGEPFYQHNRSRTAILAGRAQVLVLLFVLLSFGLGGCATWDLGKSGQRKIARKTVVIVGASSGFGRGVAEKMGAYGANVVIAARRTELLEEVASNIRAAGGTALVVTTDNSKPEDVQRLTDAAVQQYGTIDVWINMAGVGGIGRFWEIPVEDQARIVDINLKGFIYGS